MRSYNSSSRLVGLLHAWVQTDAEAARQDWAERLSRWMGPIDAITLHAAHQSILSASPAPADALEDGLTALAQDTERARNALLQAAEPPKVAPPNNTRSRSALPVPRPPASGKAADMPEFAPFRQRYLAHQRSMELKLPPLRERYRRVLTHADARLRQLAELDAALEHILGARERALLSKVPALLERRFEHWRATLGAEAALEPANDQAGMTPASRAMQTVPRWLASFSQDFQEVVRAEVDFRMAPITGLMEALSNKA